MATKNLVNHPGKWLAADAADSLARFEHDHGVQPITSAGRTLAEQQADINRWHAGGVHNRPPYLYKPAEPASASHHVTGEAVDTSNPGMFHAYGAAYGWTFDYAYDVVHFQYHPNLDRHKPKPGGTTGYSQTVYNEQTFLDAARGERLVRDGIAGPLYHAAVKRYQQFLHLHYGYSGALDGLWGPGTQAAHARYYSVWNAHR